MGVRITSQEEVVALFDSVSGFAFGPTFESEEDAENFLLWWQEDGDGRDLRMMPDNDVETAVARYHQLNAPD